METRLYVGNLPYAASEEELRSLFTQAGAVKSITVIRDRDTGESRGFGFVEMESREDAEKAIGTINGARLGDRQITVNFARTREERAAGGRGRSDHPPRR